MSVYLDPWSGAVAAMMARLAQASSLTNGAQVVEYHEIHSVAQGLIVNARLSGRPDIADNVEKIRQSSIVQILPIRNRH